MDYVWFLLYIAPVIHGFILLGPEIMKTYRGEANYKPKHPKFVLCFTLFLFLLPVVNLTMIIIVLYDEYKKQRNKP